MVINFTYFRDGKFKRYCQRWRVWKSFIFPHAVLETRKDSYMEAEHPSDSLLADRRPETPPAPQTGSRTCRSRARTGCNGTRDTSQPTKLSRDTSHWAQPTKLSREKYNKIKVMERAGESWPQTWNKGSKWWFSCLYFYTSVLFRGSKLLVLILHFNPERLIREVHDTFDISDVVYNSTFKTFKVSTVGRCWLFVVGGRYLVKR